MTLQLRDWSVDFGDGPRSIQVPHVWHLEAPLPWEGPAIYRTQTHVPEGESWLVFYGVSYEAIVRINDREVTTHRGIWDAFSVDVSEFAGQEVRLEVSVIKNGGAKFPVPEVASGFIPYVYGTFGGIFREVELIQSSSDPLTPLPAPPSRVSVDGSKIFVDGKFFYVKGVLTWGWYPDSANPHLPLDRIKQEVEQVKRLGFNLIKFCLWLPGHAYLEEMREQGLMAWIELPIWLPSDKKEALDGFRAEIRRIVDQYAHHDNILAWTVGCELSESTPADFRQEMVEFIQERTGCPMVKDNSGGAEMYGGDPREFGDFDDFHPYCDTHFYPQVLDSLLPGPRPHRPILLGEFNDYDMIKDLERMDREGVYWVSENPDLNAQGVRWMHDFPSVMEKYRAELRPRWQYRDLVKESEQQGLFMRKFVQENVRARKEISGYVITGWADTPISTSGFLNDWGEACCTPEQIADWNSELCAYIIPRRQPPWINGGNRPGWQDTLNHWTEDVYLQIGLHNSTAEDVEVDLSLEIRKELFPIGKQVIRSGDSRQIGAVHIPEVERGCTYVKVLNRGEVLNTWMMNFVEKPRNPWPCQLNDPRQVFHGFPITGEGMSVGTDPYADGLVFLLDEGTVPLPFWREATYLKADAKFWISAKLSGNYPRFLSLAPDRAIDRDWMMKNLDKPEIYMTRIDTRTFREHLVMVGGKRNGRTTFLTTLRPFGGLEGQPVGVANSPSGVAFMNFLLTYLE